MKEAIEKMRAVIKADALTARDITKQIHHCPRGPEHGPARDELWNQKRSGRRQRRERLLAYGLLRGKTYSRIEAKCDRAPHEYGIYLALRSVVPDIAMVNFSRERIQSWLLGREANRVAA